MIGKKELDKRPVSMAEVKELIEERKEEVEELNYEQNVVLESCERFSKLSLEEMKKLIDEITDLEKLNEEHAVMLSYVFPETEEDIKILFSKEHFILSDEEVEKILEILNKHRKGKKGE